MCASASIAAIVVSTADTCDSYPSWQARWHGPRVKSRAALPALRAAADRASWDGTAFLHLDLRSDNLCLLGQRVVLVDRNWAVRGPAEPDLARWLPSLRRDGGPLPELVAPGLGGYAAAIASYFAVNAALPPVPDSPMLRDFQLDQLLISLMAADSVDAHVQDDAVRGIGRRLLVWVAVAATEMDVERPLWIGFNAGQLASEFQVALRIFRIGEQQTHRRILLEVPILDPVSRVRKPDVLAVVVKPHRVDLHTVIGTYRAECGEQRLVK